jgi:hypothetical protein
MFEGNFPLYVVRIRLEIFESQAAQAQGHDFRQAGSNRSRVVGCIKQKSMRSKKLLRLNGGEAEGREWDRKMWSYSMLE